MLHKVIPPVKGSVEKAAYMTCEGREGRGRRKCAECSTPTATVLWGAYSIKFGSEGPSLDLTRIKVPIYCACTSL